MITTRTIGFKNLMKLSEKFLLWLIAFNTVVAFLYHFELIKIKIPWLPISVIGTAVAFYVGFKNNNAYGRLWEARKTWGGIVNDSRTWGMMVDGYISDTFTQGFSAADINSVFPYPRI